MKDQLPRKISKWEFKTNETKTENYTINRPNCNNHWRAYLVVY